MTNPSDPWAQRPDQSEPATEKQPVADGRAETGPQAATDKLEAPGPAADQTPTHTTDYSEAYGSGAHKGGDTASYGYPGPYQPTAPYEFPAHPQYGGEFFDQPPGPGATRELPPYDPGWGAYESENASGVAYGDPGHGPNQAYSAYPQYGPPGAGPPPAQGPADLPPEPPRRRTGLWIALIAAAFLVVVLGGMAAGKLLAGSDTSASSSSPGTQAERSEPMPTSIPDLPGNPGGGGTQPSMPQIPGLGGLDGLGATMGSVTSNDGGTLVLKSLTGSSVTVHTDDKTQVISLGSGTVADLKTGDMVVVQGDKAPDGSINAKIIITTQLPK
ncbi:MAG: hypothetical protein J2P18_03975 [Nocardia sp.]|nr:hypothetical protein [Nocardia sp.]